MFNKTKTKFNPPVFYSASVVILLLVVSAALFPKKLDILMKSFQDIIITNLSWFYILVVATILLFTIYIAISKNGEIKLGPDHSKPDYSNISWFAMLFSAGMGIGLMFFGVAEPVMHFLSPPNATAETVDAARKAMSITIFHWGFHAWAIYAIVAILLAFFSYRHKLPLTLRSALYPIIGEKIYGVIGHTVDSFAVIGTVFGVATSLGFGVLQVNAGFNHVFGMPIGINSQVILIAVITCFATLSVVTGLDKGIKMLSEINMALAVLLMFFVLIFGSSIFLLQAFIQNIGEYLSITLKATFNLFAYKKTNWIGGWTVFYWAWWISWSPFVGVFIARISKGRTIREFIIGVLFVPTGFSIAWMTFFGNSAIDLILNQGLTSLADLVSKDVSLALYAFLEQFPFSSILSILATIMVIIFFVTSADSGSMVIDMLSSYGKDDTSLWQKLYWAIGIGVIAAVLLIAGGLGALQTMTIASALPFSIILLFAMYGLLKALRVDVAKKESLQYSLVGVENTSSSFDWKERLSNLTTYPNKKNVQAFLQKSVSKAINNVVDELQKSDFNADIEIQENIDNVGFQLKLEQRDFLYNVKLISAVKPNFAIEEKTTEERNEEEFYYRAEVYLVEGGQNYDIMGWSVEGIRNDIVEQLQKHMHFIYMLN